jgi:hypothetical protein
MKVTILWAALAITNLSIASGESPYIFPSRIQAGRGFQAKLTEDV